MVDRRKHRGPHPDDAALFAAAAWPTLARATDDLCWLLSRGYSQKSAVKLVGDRYDLIARQRTAVGRCSCSEADTARRQQRRIEPAELAGRPLWIDGYNALTTVEAALADGVILPARDGTYRDMASMHGSYRKVAETLPALGRLGRVLGEWGPSECCWYLDRPVSNSGRLKKIIEDLAAEQDWPWRVELVADPDAILSETDQIVATADSFILDRCSRWLNLARETVERTVPEARVIESGIHR